MRSPFLLAVAALVAVGCSDSPTETVLAPSDALLEEWTGEPPPPWAIVHGGGTVEHEPFTFVGHFFINKPGNVAWLAFSDAGQGTFSPNARIMSVNGKVIGVGTLTLGDDTYQLNTITRFDANRACMRSPGGETSCGVFSGGQFEGGAFTWTGFMANDRFKRIGKPGGGDEACYLACDGYLKGP